MNKYFSNRFYTADATQPAGGTAPKAEPTSELLTKLKADKKTAWAAMLACTDPESKEALDAQMNVLKINGGIKAEIARINKEEADAKTQELRNKRITVRVAYGAAVLAAAAKGAGQAEKDALIALETELDNLLLPVHVSAPKDAGTSGAGTKGAKSAEIVAAYVAGKAAGKTDAQIKKELVEAGHAVGTVGSAILAHQRATGEKV